MLSLVFSSWSHASLSSDFEITLDCGYSLNCTPLGPITSTHKVTQLNFTVPLECKLHVPPSLETRLVSLETRLVSLETRLVSLETRLVSFKLVFSICILGCEIKT